MSEGFQMRNPYSGEEGRRHEALDADGIEGILERAIRTYGDDRGAGGVARRSAWARDIAAQLRREQRSIADLIVAEVGKPRFEALGEVELSAAIFDYYAENGAQFLADEPISADGVNAVVRRQPIGPILGIMPWNFPVYQAARFIAPNLVLGNPMLLKPAPQCPETGLVIERIVEDAVGNDGALQIAMLDHASVATCIADGRIRGVSFTGSERAGRSIAEQAGRNLKPIVLELGGNDPFILLGGDLRTAARDAVSARLFNAGQMCTSAKRFIVLAEHYEEFLQLVLDELSLVQPGDPSDPSVRIGPLASKEAASLLETQLEQAVTAGARLVGARAPLREGTAFSPAVLTEVDEQNPAYTTEFFGPVVQIHRVAGEAEAVRLANSTDYGLSAYVYTADDQQASRVADQLECGMVFINGIAGANHPALPFGGVKASGFGRELGRLGIEQFVNHKLIRYPDSASTTTASVLPHV